MRADDLSGRALANVGAVVLAAGASVRLGQPKQLLLWHGRSLLRHVATTSLDAGASPVVVVLGAQAERMMSELAGLAVETVVNGEWEEGIGASLRAGIAPLAARDETEGALIVLCDQPLVTPEALRRLGTTFRAEPRPVAVVSDYNNGAIGPPCLLARSLFPDLLALRGSQGARQIFARLPGSTISRVPFAPGASDIDTPYDWERLRQRDDAADG